jgi:hypothetical protein
MDKKVFGSIVLSAVIVLAIFCLGYTLGSTLNTFYPIYYEASVYNNIIYSILIVLIFGFILVGFFTAGFIRKKKLNLSDQGDILECGLCFSILISLILLLVAFLTSNNYKDPKIMILFVFYSVLGGLIGFFLMSLGIILGIKTYVKRINQKRQKDLFLPFFFLLVLIIGLSIWQIGSMSNSYELDNPPHWGYGFIKLQPLTPSISYNTSGNFTAIFTNAFNGPITINSVFVNETYLGNMSCNGSIIGNRTTERGKTFRMAFSCPKKADGEAYDLLVTINYTGTLQGKQKVLTDRGHIKDQVGY